MPTTMKRAARVRTPLTSAFIMMSLAACVGAGGPRAPEDVVRGTGRVDDACLVGERDARLGDTVHVVVDESIQPGRAPWPSQTGQRFLFAQLYETLVRVDCSGTPHPALAERWRREGPRTWVIDLRADARFSDGSPLTAADVEASWKRLPAWSLPFTVRSAMERTLVLELPLETDDAIAVLAHPALAPTKPAPRASAYPAGAGNYGVAMTPPASAILAPQRGSLPVLRVRSIGPAQARDQLDLGMTAILHADPATLDYARTRSDLVVQPLEWSETYVLVVPGRTRPDPRDEAEWLGALRTHLSDVTVPGARATTGRSWWDGAAHCETIPGTASSLARGAQAEQRAGTPARADTRIVYDALDRTAQRIAARLVAMAGFQEGTNERAMVTTAIPSLTGTTRLRATSLTAADFQRELAAGSALAYVVRLPQRTLAPCLELAAPSPVGPVIAASALAPNVVVPLVDVRPTLFMRRGAFAGTVGLLGAIRVGRVR